MVWQPGLWITHTRAHTQHRLSSAADTDEESSQHELRWGEWESADSSLRSRLLRQPSWRTMLPVCLCVFSLQMISSTSRGLKQEEVPLKHSWKPWWKCATLRPILHAGVGPFPKKAGGSDDPHLAPACLCSQCVVCFTLSDVSLRQCWPALPLLYHFDGSDVASAAHLAGVTDTMMARRPDLKRCAVLLLHLWIRSHHAWPVLLVMHATCTQHHRTPMHACNTVHFCTCSVC